jgi:hypothetical protein
VLGAVLLRRYWTTACSNCPIKARCTMGVTRREYYVSRAVECALAADQIPCDRAVLLHMAATYFRVVAEIELRQASRLRHRRENQSAKFEAETLVSRQHGSWGFASCGR